MPAHQPLSPDRFTLNICRIDPAAAVIILDIDGMPHAQVLARATQLAAALGGGEIAPERGADRYQWPLSGGGWQAWLLFEALSDALWIELAHPGMFPTFSDQFGAWIGSAEQG